MSASLPIANRDPCGSCGLPHYPWGQPGAQTCTCVTAKAIERRRECQAWAGLVDLTRFLILAAEYRATPNVYSVGLEMTDPEGSCENCVKQAEFDDLLDMLGLNDEFYAAMERERRRFLATPEVRG